MLLRVDGLRPGAPARRLAQVRTARTYIDGAIAEGAKVFWDRTNMQLAQQASSLAKRYLQQL